MTVLMYLILAGLVILVGYFLLWGTAAGEDSLTGAPLRTFYAEIELLVPGDDRFVAQRLCVNRDTAKIFRQHGVLAFRQQLRDRDRNGECRIRDAQSGDYDFVKVSTLYRFLFEAGPDGYEQLFEDWVHMAYNVTRAEIRADVAAEFPSRPQLEVVPVAEEIDAAEAAAAVSEPVHEEAEWEALSDSHETIDEQVAAASLARNDD